MQIILVCIKKQDFIIYKSTKKISFSLDFLCMRIDEISLKQKKGNCFKTIAFKNYMNYNFIILVTILGQ